MVGSDKVEVERRRRAVAPCREQLAWAMTRLNEAHWELDRLAEEWIAQADSVALEAPRARAALDRAVENYGRAYASLLVALACRHERAE